jgi:hypothetical protein
MSHNGQTTRMIPDWQQRWTPSIFGRGAGTMTSYIAGQKAQTLESYTCDHCAQVHNVIGLATEPFFCDCNRLISIEPTDINSVIPHCGGIMA